MLKVQIICKHIINESLEDLKAFFVLDGIIFENNRLPFMY